MLTIRKQYSNFSGRSKPQNDTVAGFMLAALGVRMIISKKYSETANNFYPEIKVSIEMTENKRDVRQKKRMDIHIEVQLVFIKNDQLQPQRSKYNANASSNANKMELLSLPVPQKSSFGP